MELILIKIDSPEWNEAWDWLAAHPLNEGIDNPSLAENEGFGWEYMGTYKQNDRFISSFRHKNHIRLDGVKTLYYSYTNFNPESIEKTFNL